MGRGSGGGGRGRSGGGGGGAGSFELGGFAPLPGEGMVPAEAAVPRTETRAGLIAELKTALDAAARESARAAPVRVKVAAKAASAPRTPVARTAGPVEARAVALATRVNKQLQAERPARMPTTPAARRAEDLRRDAMAETQRMMQGSSFMGRGSEAQHARRLNKLMREYRAAKKKL